MDQNPIQVLFLDDESLRASDAVTLSDLQTYGAFEVTKVNQIAAAREELQKPERRYEVALIRSVANEQSLQLLDALQASGDDLQIITILIDVDAVGRVGRSDAIQHVLARGVFANLAPQTSEREIIECIRAAVNKAQQNKIIDQYIRDISVSEDANQIVSFTFDCLKQVVGWNKATMALLWTERSREASPAPSEQSQETSQLRRFGSFLSYRGYSSEEINSDILRPIDDYPLIKSIVDSGRPFVCQDIKNQQPEGWEKLPTAQDIGSWIAMPLVASAKPIGMLTLDHHIAGHYANADRETLQKISNAAAVAIERRLRERNIRVIRDVMVKISTEYKLEDLLQKILITLGNELNSTSCSYFQRREYVERANDKYHSKVYAELFVDDRVIQWKGKPLRFEQGEGVAGWVLEHGCSRNIPDTSVEEIFKPVDERLHTSKVLSLLAVPVKIGDRTIGVLLVDHSRKGFFTEYDLELVEVLAKQVAMMIERTRALNLLGEIGASLGKQIKIDDLLHNILDQAMSITNATSGIIYRIKDSEKLDVVYRYSAPKEFKYPEICLFDDILTKNIVQEKRIEQITSKEGENKDINQELRNMEVVAVIGAPLLIDDQLIGVLHLNSTSKEYFNDVEVFSLKILANQAALAIDKAEKFDDLANKEVALRKINEAARAVARNDRLEDTFNAIAEQACTLVGAKYSHVARVVPQQDGNSVIRFVAAYPPKHRAGLDKDVGEIDLESGSEKYPRKLGITGLAVRDKKRILVKDVEREVRNKNGSEDVVKNYIPYQDDTASELAVPIFSKSNEVIGVINVEHSDVGALNDDHGEIIASFAAQAAFAMQKDEILSLTKQREDQLQRLAIITQKIVASHLDDFGSTLNQVADHVREAMGALEVVILLMKQQGNGKDQKIVVTRTYPSRADEGFGAKISREVHRPDTVTDNRNPYDLSVEVYNSRNLYLIEDIKVAEKGPLTQLLGDSVRSAVCLPLALHKGCIGVMWLSFATPQTNRYTEHERELFQLYADQIALTYDFIEQAFSDRENLDKLRKDITADLNNYYQDTRDHAKQYSRIAIGASVVGIIFIFVGLLVQSLVGLQLGLITGGVISALTGTISVLAFRRSDRANQRMDKNRKELLKIRQLSILLEHARQMGDGETKNQLQQEMMTYATRLWFEGRSSYRKHETNSEPPTTPPDTPTT